MHALDINPYLHEFFEPILFNYNFRYPWTIVHSPKGKFKGKQKGVKTPKPKCSYISKEPTNTKTKTKTETIYLLLELKLKTKLNLTKTKGRTN